MAIDVTRVKRTRGGHEVRIYATDGGATCDRIHGDLRTCKATGWQMFFWFAGGNLLENGQEHPFDLVEEPRTIEIDVWMNVYSDKPCVAWETKALADEYCDPDRIACVNIKQTVTEGEGL